MSENGPVQQPDPLRTTNRLLGGILLLMVFATIYFAKDVILPVVLGALVVLTLNPLVRGLGRMGIPAPLSAAALIFGFVGLVAVAGVLLGGSVTSWFDDIPQTIAEAKYKLHSISESVEAVKEASEQVEELANGTKEGVDTVVVKQPGLLTTAVGNVASFTTSLAVGLILAFFALSSGNLFYIKIVEAMPRLSDKKKALKVVYDIERRMSHYLIVITVINACLGVAIGMTMWVIGVPYAFVWGIAAFFLNYLPFLGGVAGTIGVAAFSLVTFDSVSYAFVAPACYQLLTAIEGQFVTPVMLGFRLRLNTVAVFLTVILWGWLWGIPGALMAVPILVLVKVICDHVEGYAVFGNFLSGRSAPVNGREATDQSSSTP